MVRGSEIPQKNVVKTKEKKNRNKEIQISALMTNENKKVKENKKTTLQTRQTYSIKNQCYLYILKPFLFQTRNSCALFFFFSSKLVILSLCKLLNSSDFS